MQTSTLEILRAALRSDQTLTGDDRAKILTALKRGPEPAPAARLIRRADVAARFGVTTRTVDGWTRAGTLRSVILPGHKRATGYREHDVVALIEGATAEGASA